MRIRDPNGRWKPHAEFPQWMVECKPDEPGQYTLLEEEGFDNDGDGQINEDGDGYYDPNRNWPWAWQPAGNQWGADDYPFSVPEVRMPADFIAAHRNIAGLQSYHNSGGMILRPPGAKGELLPESDIAVFKRIGKEGEQMLPGYRSMETAAELYEVLGGETEWVYSMQGIYGFTNELFAGYDLFGNKSPEATYVQEDERFQFNKLVLFEQGYVPWHEVDHPQYGKVEVGGFKKNWLRQPPSFMLEQECHRNMAFTLFHADQMPKVEIDAVTVKPLDGGLREVSAIIVNRRLTPTHAAIDVQHKITPPDLVSIEGKDVRVVAGFVADNVLFEKQQEQKREPGRLKVENVPSRKPVYVRWIVSGDGPITVTANSIKGGVARREHPGK